MDTGTIALIIIGVVALLAVLGWAAQAFLNTNPFR